MKDTITIDGIEYVRKDKIFDMEFTGTVSTKPSDWYEPKYGEEYWHVEEQGAVAYFWHGDTLDLGISKRQELLRTKEEAEAADAHRIALTAIKKYIAKEFGKWEPDRAAEEERWFPVYSHFNGEVYPVSTASVNSDGFIFPPLRSEKHADQLIEDMEEELKIVFGVK